MDRLAADHRAPSPADWRRISRDICARLDRRIEELETLRDRLDGCIGCGCLSLKRCVLANPGDEAGHAGPGPRFVLRGGI